MTTSASDRVLKTYKGNAGKQYHLQANEVSQKAFNLIAEARCNKIQRFVSTTDTVLEYGVGTGWNLALIDCKRRLGYDVCDYLEAGVVKSGIEYIKDLKEIADNSIDVIICHHVLEHVSEPISVLENIKRMLKPDGKFLLFVPSERAFRFRFFNPGDINSHLYSWSCQTLGNLVSKCGFRVLSCKEQTFGYEKLSSTIASRIFAENRLFRLLRHLFHLIRHDQEIFLYAKPESI